MTIDVDHRRAPDAGLVECQQCLAHARRAGEVLRDLENAEMEIRRLRRRVRDLQTELDGVREEDPRVGDALKVYEHWRATCRPKAKTFKGKRQEKVLARLKEGYSVDDLCQAVDGARAGAFVNAKGVRFDDLELVCRDATNVDRFMALAEAEANKLRADVPWKDLRAVIVELVAERYGPWLEDPMLDVSLGPCPACHPDPSDGYFPLHLSYDDTKPRAWCAGCSLDEDRLLFILDTKGTP